MIRSVSIRDAKEISDIYNYYVENDIATFDESPVTVTYFENKIVDVTKSFPWFVFEDEQGVVGYAHANFWNTRSAYSNSAEVSVYVKQGAIQKGIGTQLYTKLIDTLKESEFRVLIGGISLPNEASVRLHERFGFEKVAHFKEVGYKFNKWVDVGYWQLTVNKSKK
ncbi:Phosphinothricin acetyltransferase [Tenacibaculum sp. 190130A14a]|uniref:Phosphinothricin acetyltransferase n=1 Tax=Tenacibaculum polynesiense TaxID=3137857 RepID=A0ABM9PE40_9FLAO